MISISAAALAAFIAVAGFIVTVASTGAATILPG